MLPSLWELSSKTQPVQISLQVESRLMILSIEKFEFHLALLLVEIIDLMNPQAK